MSYFLTKSKEYTVYLSYTEVTTSFKKIGLTQNSVQVAKWTVTVQNLLETTGSQYSSDTMWWRPNRIEKKKSLKENLKESFQHRILSINKYKSMNCKARKTTVFIVTKRVLASEAKEEECWNLLISEK